MTGRLEGKIAVVTGGGQGIGRGIALRLADEGADVAIDFRTDPDEAEQVVAELQSKGRRACAIQADVGIVAECRRLIAESISRLGKLDILVNNAGIEKRADFWDVSEQDFNDVLKVNLSGVFFVTQAAVRYWMAAKQPGKVINISSVHEELPFPHFASYCASKGGLKMLTRDLAIEAAPFGITINSIAPGAIETPINKNLLSDPVKLESLLKNIPLRRLGRPEDVAGVAAFLASSDADYITGTTVFVDGGLLWNYQEQ